MPARPLEDTLVVEVGHIVAGPYAALVLADLGATVVKVERPGHGDHMREAGRTGRAIFHALNRAKQSVELDLTTDAGADAFRALVAEADVVVENLGPGVMERFGLGPDALRAANPGLVYASIKGYGDGPYADRPATDPIAEALAGLMAVTGHPDSPPARAGTSIADIAAAMNAVVAVLAALRDRDATGEGQHLRVPIFEATVSLMGYWLAYRQLFDEEPRRMGAAHSLYAPYDVYPTADDAHVFIGATSDGHWAALKDVLDLDLACDDRGERLEARDAIDAAIEARTRERGRDALVDALLGAGVPAAPVNAVGDVVADPHLEAADALVATDSPTGDATGVRVPRFPVWSDAYAVPGGDDPPALGADTEAVLAALGCSRAEIRAARGGE